MTRKYIVFVTLLILIILASLITSTTYSNNTKIDPEVFHAQGDGNGHVEVLIYFKEQADAAKIARAVQQSLDPDMPAIQVKQLIGKSVFKELQNTAKVSQASLLEELQKEAKKGTVSELESYYIVNIVFARLSPGLLEKISRRADVAYIYYNSTFELDMVPQTSNTLLVQEDCALPWNIEKIGVPKVWEKYKIDGSGVVVGIIDTGVNPNHPALKASWRGYQSGLNNPNYNWYDPVYGENMPSDNHGHGTAVSGVTLGRDSDFHIGVAPGAKWIAARGLNNIGSGSKRDLIAAGQFMLAPTDLKGKNPKPELAPDVVLCAWGADFGEDVWYAQMIENWRKAMILPVFAAGNQGPNVGSILNPANYQHSIAVGAVDANNKLAKFTSRGPGVFGKMIKPELVAPGIDIFTSRYEGYASVKGTSVAAPHVAGVAALMLSANRELDVVDLEMYLKATATPLTDADYPVSPNYGYGYGLVNAYKAVKAVIDLECIMIDFSPEQVSLNESWLITFNRGFNVAEIDGIVIENDNVFISIDVELMPEDWKAVVTPVGEYLPGETYNLRIYLNNSNRYKMYFDTVKD